MFTYAGLSTVHMARNLRTEEFSSARRTLRRPIIRRRLRAARPTPASVLSSRWWVASEAMKNWSGTGGTARPA